MVKVLTTILMLLATISIVVQGLQDQKDENVSLKSVAQDFDHVANDAEEFSLLRHIKRVPQPPASLPFFCLLFNQCNCWSTFFSIQNIVYQQVKVSLKTQLGRPLSHNLDISWQTEAQTGVISFFQNQKCGDFEVLIKSAIIKDMATEELDSSAYHLVFGQDRQVILVINTTNCAHVGKHRLTLQVVSTGYQYLSTTYYLPTMEFDVDVEITMCQLKNKGLILDRRLPPIEVPLNAGLIEIYDASEMWEETSEESQEESTKTFCSSGFQLKLQNDSVSTHGRIANKKYLLNTNKLSSTFNNSVKLALHHNPNCPDPYSSNQIQVELLLDLTLQDQQQLFTNSTQPSLNHSQSMSSNSTEHICPFMHQHQRILSCPTATMSGSGNVEIEAGQSNVQSLSVTQVPECTSGPNEFYDFTLSGAPSWLSWNSPSTCNGPCTIYLNANAVSQSTTVDVVTTVTQSYLLHYHPNGKHQINQHTFTFTATLTPCILRGVQFSYPTNDLLTVYADNAIYYSSDIVINISPCLYPESDWSLSFTDSNSYSSSWSLVNGLTHPKRIEFQSNQLAQIYQTYTRTITATPSGDTSLTNPSQGAITTTIRYYVDCTSTAISTSSFPSSFTQQKYYTVTQTQQVFSMQFDHVPSQCTESIKQSYTLQNCDSSYTSCSTVTSNTFIRDNSNSYWLSSNNQYTSTSFNIYTEDNNNVGFYIITLQATLSATKDSATITSSTVSFQLEIISSCTIVSFDATQLSSVEMSIQMDQSEQINIFTYSLPGFTTPSCGTQSWSFGLTQLFQVTQTSQTSTSKTLLYDSYLMQTGKKIELEITVTLDDWAMIEQQYKKEIIVYQAILSTIPEQIYLVNEKEHSYLFSISFFPAPSTDFEMGYSGYGSAEDYDPRYPTQHRTTLPSESTFNCKVTQGEITFYTSLSQQVGIHVFEYNAEFLAHPTWYNVSEFLTINVQQPEYWTPNNAPYLESSKKWQSPQYLGCGQELDLEIPNVLDGDIDDYGEIYRVDIGRAFIFATYNPERRKIEIPKNVIAQQFNGEYLIDIILVDQKGLFAKEQMKLIIQCDSDNDEETFQIKRRESKNLNPRIILFNQMGQLLIGFGVEMHSLTPEEVMNSTIKNENDIEKPILELNIERADSESTLNLNFTWNVTEFTTTILKLQLYFDEPSHLSISIPRDTLQVTFNGFNDNQERRLSTRKLAAQKNPDWEPIFEALNGAIFSDGVTLEAQVPCQAKSKIGKAVQSSGQTVQVFAKAQVILTFIFSLILQSKLNEMFSAIKKLQLVLHMTLVELAIPGVTQIFFSYLLDICGFSIWPTDEVYSFLFQLPEQDPVTLNFDQVGYGTNYYTLNVGDLFVIALSFPVSVLIAKVLTKINSKKYQKTAQKLTEPIYWEGPLALIEETFMITCISALLGVVYYEKLNLSNPGELFNFLCSVIMTVFVLIWPFVVLYVLYNNFESIRIKTSSAKKYEHLWYELSIPKKSSLLYKYNTGYFGIVYQVYSLLRRLFISLTVVCLIDHSLFSLFIFNFTTLAAMIIAGLCQAFHSKNDNMLEMQNELLILFMNYHLLYFTDFCLSPKVRIITGWSLVLLCCFFLCLNLGGALKSSAIEISTTLKLKYLAIKRMQNRFRKNSYFDSTQKRIDYQNAVRYTRENPDSGLTPVYDRNGKLHIVQQKDVYEFLKLQQTQKLISKDNVDEHFRRPYLADQNKAVKIVGKKLTIQPIIQQSKQQITATPSLPLPSTTKSLTPAFSVHKKQQLNAKTKSKFSKQSTKPQVKAAEIQTERKLIQQDPQLTQSEFENQGQDNNVVVEHVQEAKHLDQSMSLVDDKPNKSMKDFQIDAFELALLEQEAANNQSQNNARLHQLRQEQQQMETYLANQYEEQRDETEIQQQLIDQQMYQEQYQILSQIVIPELEPIEKLQDID